MVICHARYAHLSSRPVFPERIQNPGDETANVIRDFSMESQQSVWACSLRQEVNKMRQREASYGMQTMRIAMPELKMK